MTKKEQYEAPMILEENEKNIRMMVRLYGDKFAGIIQDQDIPVDIPRFDEQGNIVIAPTPRELIDKV